MSPVQLGTIELMWYPYDSSSLDRAVVSLEAAWRQLAEVRESERVAAGVNLATAYMLRARRDSSPLDDLRALDLLAAVPTANDDAALFNRALVLGHLGLRSAAEVAWVEYLDADPSSDWAEEARTRVDSLRVERIVPFTAIDWASVRTVGAWDSIVDLARSDPQKVRELGLSEFLVRSVDVDTSTFEVQLAEYLADGLVDRSLAETLSAHRDGVAAAQLRLSLSLYSEGMRLRGEREFQEATAVLDSARAQAAAAGAEAIAGWAEVEAGSSRFAAFDYAGAVARFQRVLDRTDSELFPALSGRALWGLGMVAAREGRPEASLRGLIQAGDLFDTAREPRNAAFMYSAVAHMYGELGRPQEAWSYHAESVRELGRGPPTTQLHTAVWELSDAAHAAGLSLAARELQHAGLNIAEQTGEDWAIGEALVHLARQYVDTEPWTAAQILQRARPHVLAIADSVSRARGLADLAETRGALSVLGSAVQWSALDSAVNFYEEAGNQINLASVYSLRARVARAEGDLQRARDELDNAARVVENQRLTLEKDAFRTGYATVWQEIFDSRAAIEVERDPWLALSFVERSRENHFEVLSDTTPRRLRPAPGSVFIQYAELDDVVYRWVLADSVSTHSRIASADSIRALVSGALEALNSFRAEPAQLLEVGRALGGHLLPWGEAILEHRRHVVVVTDGVLADLPFQILSWQDSVSVAEASTVRFQQSFRRALSEPARGPFAVGADRALVVGRPDLGVDSWALPDLAAAESEARAIVQLVPGSTLLLDESANRQALFEELDKHSIFHFAGHAVSDSEHPDASYLALSLGKSAGVDRLYGRELLDRQFDKLRLVVLSACATAAGPARRAGGLWALAGPFLFGGVDGVVGTLWPVDDIVAARFTTELYDQLVQGVDLASAMAEARLRLQRSDDPRLSHARGWAAFQLYGS